MSTNGESLTTSSYFRTMSGCSEEVTGMIISATKEGNIYTVNIVNKPRSCLFLPAPGAYEQEKASDHVLRMVRGVFGFDIILIILLHWCM